jgi:hypothetical protein
MAGSSSPDYERRFIEPEWLFSMDTSARDDFAGFVLDDSSGAIARRDNLTARPLREITAQQGHVMADPLRWFWDRAAGKAPYGVRIRWKVPG